MTTQKLCILFSQKRFMFSQKFEKFMLTSFENTGNFFDAQQCAVYMSENLLLEF